MCMYIDIYVCAIWKMKNDFRDCKYMWKMKTHFLRIKIYFKNSYPKFKFNVDNYLDVWYN